MNYNLKHIEINIGKACNNKCRFCMSLNPEKWDLKFVSLPKIKEKIDLYSQKGYKSIGYLGGDISIHPKINEIIKYSKEKGFEEINIITNGMIFSDHEKALKIVESGVTRVNISIHSHLKKIEDYLTQVPGGLEKKIKAIENFNDLYNKSLLKTKLSVNLVLNNKNYKNIFQTILFFYFKLNISDIRINFIWLNNDNKNDWDNLKLSFTDFLSIFKKIIYFSLKEKIRLTFDAIPPCIFYKFDKKNYKFLIKKFLGEEFDYISEIDWGNNNTNFNWQEKKKNELKMQFKQCSDCVYKNTCQGVWKEYYQLYGSDEFTPILN